MPLDTVWSRLVAVFWLHLMNEIGMGPSGLFQGVVGGSTTIITLETTKIEEKETEW